MIRTKKPDNTNRKLLADFFAGKITAEDLRRAAALEHGQGVRPIAQQAHLLPAGPWRGDPGLGHWRAGHARWWEATDCRAAQSRVRLSLSWRHPAEQHASLRCVCGRGVIYTVQSLFVTMVGVDVA